MHNSNVGAEVSNASTVNAVILISSTGKALTAFFSTENEKRKFIYFKELSLRSPLEMLDLLDQFQPGNLQLISASTDFTLVPSFLMDAEAEDDRQWLEQLPGRNPRDIVFSEKDPSQSFKLVFSESANHLSFFSQIRSDVQIRHLVSVTHENCSINRLASLWSKVVCFFLEKNFFVIVYKDNEIKLANSFQFEVAADVLYYLLWVKNEIYTGEEEVPFYFNGLISRESKIFSAFKFIYKEP
jgi:hypothetical protein